MLFRSIIVRVNKLLIGLLIGLLSVSLLACGGSDLEKRDPPSGSEQGGEKKNEGEIPNGTGSIDEDDPETELAFADPNFEPIIISGKGDSIKKFDNVGAPAIAHITGNSGSRHFSVTSFGPNEEYFDLLVNTTEIYDGIVLLDSDTVEFEISATGSWEIEIRPLVTARSVGVNDNIEITDYSGKISGRNDEVIIVVSNQDSTLVSIKGNSGERHFAVTGYGDSDWDLMVNTTDAYEGTVRLPKGNFVVLEINAVGNWEMEFE